LTVKLEFNLNIASFFRKSNRLHAQNPQIQTEVCKKSPGWLEKQQIGLFIDSMTKAVNDGIVRNIHNENTVTLRKLFFKRCFDFRADVFQNPRTVGNFEDGKLQAASILGQEFREIGPQLV